MRNFDEVAGEVDALDRQVVEESGYSYFNGDEDITKYQDAIARAASSARKDGKSEREIESAEESAKDDAIKQLTEQETCIIPQLRSPKQTKYQDTLREIKEEDFIHQAVVSHPIEKVGERKVEPGNASKKIPTETILPMITPPDHVFVETTNGLVLAKNRGTQQESPQLLCFSSTGQGVATGYCVNCSSMHHETIAGTSVPYKQKRPTGMRGYPIEFKAGDFDYTTSTGEVIKFDFGHGIDFKHGNGATTYCRENYTPQNPKYNRTIREQGLMRIVNRLDPKGYYSEIAVYSKFPKKTKNGTPIPEGFIFNILDANKQIQESYYISNWGTEEEYKKCTKKEETPQTQVFLEYCRIIISMDILRPIVYDKSQTNEYYLQELGKKFWEAMKIAEERFDALIKSEVSPVRIPDEAKKALVQFIILNLLEQVGSIEYLSTCYRCSLITILLGISRFSGLEGLQDDSRAKELLQRIEEQTLQELELLTFSLSKTSADIRRTNQDEQTDWTPEEYQKMINQMVDLYEIYRRSGSIQSSQRIYEYITKEVSAARNEGFIIFCNIKPLLQTSMSAGARICC